MNPEVKAQWIEALESGEYTQAKFALTKVAEDGTESNCCLGVLTELAVKAGVCKRIEVYDDGVVAYGDGNGDYQSHSTLPTPVQRWAGLTDDNPFLRTNEYGSRSLATMNDDDGLDFPTIAAMIRDYL